MGSIDAACIAGFLCRLCSEMHRTVIHIYSDQGQKHGLAGKINAYLPVTITPTDPLPKTICKGCMKRVEQHHELMVKIQKHRAVFNAQSSRLNRTDVSSQHQTESHSNRSHAQQQNNTESMDDDNNDGDNDEGSVSTDITNSSTDNINSSSNNIDVENNAICTDHTSDMNNSLSHNIDNSDGNSSSSSNSNNITIQSEQEVRP